MKTTSTFYLLLFFIFSSYAQQGKLDPTFNTLDNGLVGDGFDATVRTILLQADNKLIVGGLFNNFNGATVSKLCRLDEEGSIDPSFHTGSGFDNTVYCSLLLSNSDLIIGGNFKTYNGNAVNKIVKLDSNGSLDALFSANFGVITTGIIHTMAASADQTIIVAGTFTKIGSTTVNRIARISSDGVLDPTFSVGSGASHQINVVKIQTDNKILVGGNFTSFSGNNSNRIVRLNTDGSIDTTFDIGTGFDNDVETIEIQLDGKILIGGNFTNYKGTTANKLIRLNSDGSVDSTFNLGSGFNGGIVYIIKEATNGDIMVGGSFTGSYNGIAVNRLVYLNSQGNIKTEFDIGDGPGSTVYALATNNSDTWYLGGVFKTYNALNQGRVTKVDNLGSLTEGYLTPNVGFNSVVYKAIPSAGKKIMVGGNFKKFNGEATSKLIRVDESGSLDLSFNQGQTGVDNLVRAILIQSDDKLIIGGAFKKYNEISCNRIVGLHADGSINSEFQIGTGFNDQVYVITRQQDGKLLIGGNFTSYNNTTANRIIRLNSDGSVDTTFSTLGANSYVEGIVEQPDGKIIVVGRFTDFNGISSSRIVRLNTNGSTDTSFVVGSGFDKNSYAIALQPDGKILVGGAFITYKGTSQKRIVRLNSDGSLDTSFAIGTGFSKGDIRTILLQKDGRILVGGTFSGNYNGALVSKFLRLHKEGSIDSSLSVALNGSLYSIAITEDFKALIGGDFNSVAGKSKHRIARLRLCTNSSTYSGTWSNEAPNGGMEVTFNENYTFPNSLNMCSCSVALGKEVTVAEGQTLGLMFDYKGDGNLIVEDKASLYQDDDEIVNSGIAQIKKKSTPMKNFDYTYWSSPVKDQKAKLLSPNTFPDKYHVWKDKWEFYDQEMKFGIGYIIRVPKPGEYANGEKAFENNATTYEQPVTFEGIPNNGIVTGETTLADHYYLVGNPYPSAIAATAFLDKNPFIGGTVYLWTHNTPITKNGSKYVYDSADFASFNATGAVTTGPKGVVPTGNIASGQSFFVVASEVGTIEFDNSMRLRTNNDLFFKPKKTQKNVVNEEGKVWLNLTNEEGVFKQILIGYCNSATNNYDTRFDGMSMNGNSFVDFYSCLNSNNYVIQGRALPFELSDEVPLGYSSKVKGDFVITIDKTEGMLKNHSIYLEDKKTNSIHDLSNKSYVFSTEIGDFKDRFVLKYQKNLNLIDNENNSNLVFVSYQDKKVKMGSFANKIQEIAVYDLSGRKLFSKNKLDTHEYSWDVTALSPQVVVVKTKCDDNQSTVQKVIIH